MTSKKRLIYAVIALVAVVVAVALVLITILPSQASAPQSLARKMVIDSSDPSVSGWRDNTPPWWDMTGKNSHIDYAADCEYCQVHGLLIVWNSISEAVANFHSLNLTSNYHNLTIGDESSIVTYESALDVGGYRVMEIYFIRGNVTAGLRFQIYPSADEVGIEESLMLALAQDMKILQVQAAIEKPL